MVINFFTLLNRLGRMQGLTPSATQNNRYFLQFLLYIGSAMGAAWGFYSINHGVLELGSFKTHNIFLLFFMPVTLGSFFAGLHSYVYSSLAYLIDYRMMSLETKSYLVLIQALDQFHVALDNQQITASEVVRITEKLRQTFNKYERYLPDNEQSMDIKQAFKEWHSEFTR